MRRGRARVPGSAAHPPSALHILHHRHHLQQHCNKKHEEKSEREGEDINLPPPPPPPPPVAVNIARPDEDVEEGEILKKEGFGCSKHKIEEKRFDSDY
jgi:hypothetical protein